MFHIYIYIYSHRKQQRKLSGRCDSVVSVSGTVLPFSFSASSFHSAGKGFEGQSMQTHSVVLRGDPEQSCVLALLSTCPSVTWRCPAGKWKFFVPVLSKANHNRHHDSHWCCFGCFACSSAPKSMSVHTLGNLSSNSHIWFLHGLEGATIEHALVDGFKVRFALSPGTPNLCCISCLCSTEEQQICLPTALPTGLRWLPRTHEPLHAIPALLDAVQPSGTNRGSLTKPWVWMDPLAAACHCVHWDTSSSSVCSSAEANLKWLRREILLLLALCLPTSPPFVFEWISWAL